ncbi:MAG: hypothetical protein ACI4J7_10740 [Ruminiclostridium sp.]
MKKILKFSMILILPVILSGCFPTGENIQYSNYLDDNKNIIYDVNTSKTDTIVPLFSGKHHEWDTDALKKTLMPDFSQLDSNLIKTEEWNMSNGKCCSYSLNDGRTLEVWADSAYIRYLRDANNISTYGISSGSYITFYGCSEESMLADYPLIEYENFKSSQAVEIADRIVNELDIPNLDAPMVFSCESDISEFTLSLYPEVADEYTEDELEAMKGNKAYYVLYTQTYNGVKLPVDNMTFETTGIYGVYTTVDFIIDKNGIVSFHANNVLDLIPLNETAQICTSEEALETCKKTIGMSKEVNGAIIKGGELTYISNCNSDGTYSFFPAWKFIKHVNEPDEINNGKFQRTTYQTYYYNAATKALLV